MLTATTTLAKRIELAEARLITGMGHSVSRRLGPAQVIVVPVGSAAAVMPGPGSQLSKVAGLGFEPLDQAALTHVEQEFARFGTSVRVELSSLADPAIGTLLSARVRSVGLRECARLVPRLCELASVGDFVVGRFTSETIDITETSADDFDEWAAAVATGFMHPDAFDGPPPLEPPETSGIDLIFRDMASLDGFSQYIARREGQVAGGASMRIDNGIAQLCGAATLPQHRRRGIQTALLRERLARAAAAGCDVAVITTEPGSKSQANAQRQGFELLYVRAVLIKAF